MNSEATPKADALPMHTGRECFGEEAAAVESSGTGRDSLASISMAAEALLESSLASPHRRDVVRDEFGLEHAQALLGHAKPDMTSEYSRRLDRLAADVATSIG